ncbi:hypothetical protein QBC34DRAFT_387704 [Podospora aff. communis PSN243]|uniref:Uncharacterized protein n=1 Tax=Podospora aff. communis PSN243 TaxID=3040156 RepID=A0AAV9FZF6_9PEZI|nr:hypothetical protein QBC34DRAFT_387704 [Podospora aff. communis PSN243]
MQFTTAFLTVALAFAAGTLAAPAPAPAPEPAPEPWTKDAKGNWVANNSWWPVNYRGQEIRAHESCTWQGQPVARDPGTKCSYWTNANGGQFHGNCLYLQNGNSKTMSCARL